MRRLRVRTSLLAEFAAVSFVALAVLGVVLAQTFLRTMHEEERSRATEIATLTAKADVRPRIPVEDLDAVLGNGEETALDAKLRAVSAGTASPASRCGAAPARSCTPPKPPSPGPPPKSRPS